MERQVKTDKGIVEGVLRDECIVFKGIPYAKPPIGELRWKAPRKWTNGKAYIMQIHFRPCVFKIYQRQMIHIQDDSSKSFTVRRSICRK